MIFDVHKTVKYVWGFEIQIRIRVYWKMDIFLNGDLKVLRKEITNQTELIYRDNFFSFLFSGTF